MAIDHERPVSPLDGIWLKDDFLSNDSVADAVIFDLDFVEFWQFRA